VFFRYNALHLVRIEEFMRTCITVMNIDRKNRICRRGISESSSPRIAPVVAQSAPEKRPAACSTPLRRSNIQMCFATGPMDTS